MMPGAPQLVRELLGACPTAGNGVHAWIFQCALALRRAGYSEGEMAEMIEGAAVNCGRALEAHEIPDAIKNSGSRSAPSGTSARGGGMPPPRAARWPAAASGRIQEIIRSREARSLYDLWEASPVRLEDHAAEYLIDRLFPGNPLLCCGRSHGQCETTPREEWRGQLPKLQFIVPNPMAALRGTRKSDGQPSPRALDNTGPRRFLVIEFDDNLGEDSQAARLWHLNSLSPLVLAVHSGGKSLHGWFCTVGDAESAWLKFMRYAVSLGADPATWTRCQFVRLPDGMRRPKDKAPIRQVVYFFNPEALPC
jgi:hypothetical protein